MKALVILLFLISIVSFVMFIVQIVRKKPFKKFGIVSLLLLGFCIIFFIVTLYSNNKEKQSNCDHNFVVLKSKTTSCDEKKNGWIKYKCSECNLKKTEETEPTHTFGEWETTKEPTCSEEGLKKRNCTVCNLAEETESLAKINHTFGEWETTKEPTCTEEGIKKRNCTVCNSAEETEKLSKVDHKYIEGEIISVDAQNKKVYKKTKCSICGAEGEKSGTLSESELIKYYKDNAKSYGYEEIARNPDEYKGKVAVFTGEVIQVSGDILRVSITSYGTYSTYYKDPIYVEYYYEDGLKVLEDDIITMYGVLKGETTYKTVLGAYVTIPSFNAYYAELIQ